MKHSIFLKTLPFVALFALTACNPGGSKTEIYQDNPLIKDGSLTLSFEKPTESFLQNNYLTMYMNVVSSDSKPQDFTFKNPKIIREENKAEYTVGCLEILPITLQCDVKWPVRFSATLPTLLKDSFYTFEFEYNKSKKVSYHLYPKPTADSQNSLALVLIK